MRPLPTLCALIGTLLFLNLSAQAGEPISRQAALERIAKADTPEADWFADSFLKAVPMTQIQLIMAQLHSGLGKFEEVRPDGRNFFTVYEKGVVPTQITLDKEGRVIGLFFGPPKGRSESLAAAAEEFKKLPGKVAVLTLVNGKATVEQNADESLAVGSAFKLAVLQALLQKINAKELSWEQVVPLRDDWKSLPSGTLQTWPAGSRLTVETLASLMISVSDNTATDHLIGLLTPRAVQTVAPSNEPFLTTHELFKLKTAAQADLRKRYLDGDGDVRRRFLAKEVAELPLPAADEVPATPTALELEWYFTATQLADKMLSVKDLPLMTINPGIARKEDWQRVAYKGGSEPGVLCLVTWAKAKDGRDVCAVAIWNNPDAVLDETKFFTLYGDLLDKLK